MEEAEREMQTGMGKVQVNEQPKQPKSVSGSAPEKDAGGKGGAAEVNLLDLGGQEQPANLVQEMNSLTDLLGTGPSMPAQTKMKFQDSHPENFAPQQTVDLPVHNSLSMHGCGNAPNWKGVLPASAKEGTLYQQGDLEITIQIQVMKYLVRSLLSFKCTNVLATVADISVDIANKQGLKDALQIECSPVRYQSG